MRAVLILPEQNGASAAEASLRRPSSSPLILLPESKDCF